jgi:hypothetical protein
VNKIASRKHACRDRFECNRHVSGCLIFCNAGTIGVHDGGWHSDCCPQYRVDTKWRVYRAVSLPPTIQHSALHAENAGPIYFSNRLRIADVRPSIHLLPMIF